MSCTNDIISHDLVKLFRKKKDTVRAVDGVSIEIKKGELFGLLGPNGAGKTTFIKCISTLLIPDSGSAWVGGYDVRKQSLNVRQVIGVLTSGERSLYWKLTPMENLRYFAALYGVPRRSTAGRIAFLLDLMELTDRASDRVEKLSSGMKQKLAIARTLLHDPPIFLIDEPTLGLDPSFSRFIRKFIKDELHKKEGKTILLTTHYMDEADELCDRVAFMDQGRIRALDTPHALKKKMPQEQVIEVKCLGLVDEYRFKDFKVENDLQISVVDGFSFLRIATGDTEKILSQVVDLIGNHAKVLSVNVDSPTLEDVFVHLTGTSLKDEHERGS